MANTLCTNNSTSTFKTYQSILIIIIAQSKGFLEEQDEQEIHSSRQELHYTYYIAQSSFLEEQVEQDLEIHSSQSLLSYKFEVRSTSIAVNNNPPNRVHKQGKRDGSVSPYRIMGRYKRKCQATPDYGEAGCAGDDYGISSVNRRQDLRRLHRFNVWR